MVEYAAPSELYGPMNEKDRANGYDPFALAGRPPLYFDKWNMIGTVIREFTVTPLFIAGVQGGMVLTTRTASRSKPLPP